MLTPDVIEFKRRQLASLREAHPEPSPEVAAAMQRLADEVDPPRTHADELADQLAAAQAIIAGLQGQVASLTDQLAVAAGPLAAARDLQHQVAILTGQVQSLTAQLAAATAPAGPGA